MTITRIDQRAITWFGKLFEPVARVSICTVYVWFGVLKLLDLSPASPLAQALTAQTIGAEHFDLAFKALAVVECVIGLLFLFPKATRIVIPLLLAHLLVVCSPLFLVPDMAWDKLLVPTLEGQYIIKNMVIAALAVGIAAQTRPLKAKTR